jgi:hypothetical protein
LKAPHRRTGATPVRRAIIATGKSTLPSTIMNKTKEILSLQRVLTSYRSAIFSLKNLIETQLPTLICALLIN